MHSIPAKQTDFSKDCTTVSSISYSKIKRMMMLRLGDFSTSVLCKRHKTQWLWKISEHPLVRETLTERKKMQILSYHVQIISRTLNEREEVETGSLLKACDIIEHF